MDIEPTFFNSPGAGGSVGQPLDRVDGRDKVTGKARYAAEFPLAGLVYGVLRTSEIAKGKITRIDTAAAAKEPGVIAIFTHENLPKLAKTPNTPEGKKAIGAPMGFMPLTGNEIHYANQPVAVVLADTFERATHAASLVKVSYEQAQPIASYLDQRPKYLTRKRCRMAKRTATHGAARRRRRWPRRPFS
jgi:xanthine dehydrogenase YagR molybdenum-binding subunit